MPAKKAAKKATKKAAKKTKTVYLVKANNDLISHCACSNAVIGAPAQMDCPWCGCGWLFVCSKCRKAFSFARAEEPRSRGSSARTGG